MQLTSLDISRMWSVTDASLSFVVGMPLTTLSLAGCKYVSAAGMSHLVGMPLTQLNLGDCERLLDDALEVLQVKHFPTFEAEIASKICKFISAPW